VEGTGEEEDGEEEKEKGKVIGKRRAKRREKEVVPSPHRCVVMSYGDASSPSKRRGLRLVS